MKCPYCQSCIVEFPVASRWVRCVGCGMRFYADEAYGEPRGVGTGWFISFVFLIIGCVFLFRLIVG